MSTKYTKTVSHYGLNEFRVVRAATSYELDMKVRALEAQWNERWAKKVERETNLKNDADCSQYAITATQQAENIQKALDEILMSNLVPKDIDFNKMKKEKTFLEFSVPYPHLQSLNETIRPAPQISDSRYRIKPSFWTRISKKRMAKFVAENKAVFQRDLDRWQEEKDSIDNDNKNIENNNNLMIEEWTQKKDEFMRLQNEQHQAIDALNKTIDDFVKSYQAGNVKSVEEYFSMLLKSIHFPFDYERLLELEYNPDGKSLIIDMFFPAIDNIPNLKSISYVKSKKEFKTTYHTDAYLKKKYDSVIYQIVLTVLNYVFSLNSFVDVVVINGQVATIDKATGKNIKPCILSVSVSRSDFEEINLDAVDPKTWFKSAKGVSAASLANVTPVAPIVTMSREDKRFIESYAVADELDECVNLAAIDWQDFENLIREIFEKEFSTNGGEVKITQASRDGGVDAVAFDPDPIRGGKIVIQAKRYTNVVGVSAVRDLYGNVMNEGATKGIF